MIRFAVLADTHYHPTAFRDWGAPKMLSRSGEVLAASVPAVNALTPDFIVHVGDLLCGGGSFDLPSADYERSLRDVGDAYSGFDAPLYCVPGNHDCDAQTDSFDALHAAFSMPQPFDVIDLGSGWRLARAHLYHDGGTTGRWTAALDAALRDADAEARKAGENLLLVLHEWFLPSHLRPGDSPDKGCVVDAALLRHTLLNCPSVAVTFSGHRHVNRIRLWHDLVVIDTACLVGHPLGLREILLEDDGRLEARFHVLDLPDLLAASQSRLSREQNERYAGEENDRNTIVVLPRRQRR